LRDDHRVGEALRARLPLRLELVPDWEDVLARAGVSRDGAGAATNGGRSRPDRRARSVRRRPRLSRRLLLAATLVLALLLSAPAWSGVGYEWVVHLVSGEPPKPIKEQLQRLDQGGPVGMGEHPLIDKTGKVYERQTSRGPVSIWLTPTKSGGYCANLVTPQPGRRSGPSSGGCFPAQLRRPIEVSASGMGTDFSAVYLSGRVTAKITRLAVRYVNGGSEQVPIQDGFFVAAVDPVRTLELTDHPHELVGYDANGHVVDRESLDDLFRFGSFGSDRPPVADITRERKAETVPLRGGSAALYLSPSRLGGSCARVNAGDTAWSWSCADPARLPAALRLQLTRVPDRSAAGFAILVHGVARTGAEVVFRYADGARAVVPLFEQNFLVVLPHERWQAGRRLIEIDARTPAGVQLRVPIAHGGDAFYTGGADRAPQHAVVQITNPPDLPIVAKVETRGEHGQKIVFFVKRQTATHWYQVLIVDGKPIAGEDLQWFPNPDGSPGNAIGFEGIPVLSPDGTSDLSLLVGNLRGTARSARVLYGDGSSQPLELTRPTAAIGGGITGFFVYEVTQSRRNRKPMRFDALDAGGRVVGRTKIPLEVRS